MRMLYLIAVAALLAVAAAGCGPRDDASPLAPHAPGLADGRADAATPGDALRHGESDADRDDHDGDRDDDGDDDAMHTWRVTLVNLSETQPIAPAVIATHRKGMHIFRAGHPASPALEIMAEDGDPGPVFEMLGASPRVTDVVNVGMPLTRRGTTVGGFADRVTVTIRARRGDRISVAGMLICTNDGIAGLDGAKLPRKGRRSYRVRSWDAGTEMNTERSIDIVDACSALGAVALPGDPNGNRDAEVDMMPHRPVMPHPGVAGVGDLDPEMHEIERVTARLIVEPID